MAHARIVLLVIWIVLLAQTAAKAEPLTPEAAPSAEAAEPVCNGKYKGGVKPSDAELKEILKQHAAWLKNGGLVHLGDPKVANDPRRANLCDADLDGADLDGVNLYGAVLSGANLSDAHLKNAKLGDADLRGTILEKANLDEADLGGAKLNGADLSDAQMKKAVFFIADLRNAELGGAQLTSAHLNQADLTHADLGNANFEDADLTSTHLERADLSGAHLKGADLEGADLNKANLSNADLKNANLAYVAVSKANIDHVDLTDAIYAPTSEAPDSYVAGIRGIATIKAAEGEEIGLVQLRKLLQDAGLRDSAREATFSIQRNITRDQLSRFPSSPWIQGILRTVGFEWTTSYGLHPEQALRWILLLGAILIPVYMFAIRWSTTENAIVQVFPADRLDVTASDPSGEQKVKKQQLVHAKRWRDAIPAAAYFSLISAINIGFEDFTPGDWIRRLQTREYSLEAVGWVRVVSGAQSLLSVYLLAMWVLTQFGQPFG